MSDKHILHGLGIEYKYIDEGPVEISDAASRERDLKARIAAMEAALAERDRMLRLLIPEFVHGVERSPDGIDNCDACKHVLADLRARAEERSRDTLNDTKCRA